MGVGVGAGVGDMKAIRRDANIPHPVLTRSFVHVSAFHAFTFSSTLSCSLMSKLRNNARVCFANFLAI